MTEVTERLWEALPGVIKLRHPATDIFHFEIPAGVRVEGPVEVLGRGRRCFYCFHNASVGHFEEVEILTEPAGSKPRAYIGCPEAGRVSVDMERLQQWSLNLVRRSCWDYITGGSPPA